MTKIGFKTSVTTEKNWGETEIKWHYLSKKHFSISTWEQLLVFSKNLRVPPANNSWPPSSHFCLAKGRINSLHERKFCPYRQRKGFFFPLVFQLMWEKQRNFRKKIVFSSWSETLDERTFFSGSIARKRTFLALFTHFAAGYGTLRIKTYPGKIRGWFLDRR